MSYVASHKRGHACHYKRGHACQLSQRTLMLQLTELSGYVRSSIVMCCLASRHACLARHACLLCMRIPPCMHIPLCMSAVHAYSPLHVCCACVYPPVLPILPPTCMCPSRMSSPTSLCSHPCSHRSPLPAHAITRRSWAGSCVTVLCYVPTCAQRMCSDLCPINAAHYLLVLTTQAGMPGGS
jgi:hypothetical protein